MAKLDVQKARDLLQGFDFGKLFVEVLGWSQPTNRQSTSFDCKGGKIQRKQIAQLSGVVVLEVTSSDGKIPDRITLAAIHKEISKLHHENLLVFVDNQRTQSLWYWVKREDAKLLPREHLYVKGQPGDLFLSKLSSMVFDMSEFDAAGNVPVVNVANRLKDALDVERVTKKFYTDYKSEHIRFVDLIEGIDNERDRQWYGSVLLNRLMFIYFLQRKFFLDKGDGDYLQRKLASAPRTDTYWYYGTFLRMLFFEGFAKPEHHRSGETKKLLGDIKFLNGGLFLPHKIEENKRYKISIPNQAFQNILELFGRYSWNLDDTPGGNDDEIRPDVLGYIFEKYINQKAFGAYYTRTEITEYLCEQTINRLILERINALTGTDVPGAKAEATRYANIADLLLNLNSFLCRQLLFEILPSLTILDPACGSGAFLVAAMKTLIRTYSAVIGRTEFLHDRSLKDQVARMRREHKSIAYFIRRSIITNNLFGVDIMEEGSEIAKLRLFLALVASAEASDQLEPLPNIDFNILTGNSLIGLMHVDDKEFDKRHAQGHLFRKHYCEILADTKRKIKIYRENAAYSENLVTLRNEIDELKRETSLTLNEILLMEFQQMGIRFEQATWDNKKDEEGKHVKRSLRFDDIKELKPFDWGYEFDEIINGRGGFDVIITNPPWEVFQTNEKEFFQQYSPSIQKKKLRIEDWIKRKDELLNTPDTKADWLAYVSLFPHQLAYFKKAPHFSNQTSVVENKTVGNKPNLYCLFAEQCFNLLRKGGECGIVLPSGIYTDLGTKQLREMLFGQTEITGLFAFENRKFIFENIDVRFKFVVLTFRKGGKTESFPAAFMRHDAGELESFPKEGGLRVPVSLVKQLSPDSLSIPEFRTEEDIRISEKLLTKPLAADRSQGWGLELYGEELNMTRSSGYFRTSKTKCPVYEGGMIWQFTNTYSEPRYWVKESELRRQFLEKRAKRIQFSQTPPKDLRNDYEVYRIAIRKIASNTNERTLISTVIPPFVFAGNSLSVNFPFHNSETDYNTLQLSDREIVALVALLNSFVVDYTLRSRMTTNLNLFYINQLPLPRLTENDQKSQAIIERAARLICTTTEFDDLAREVGLRDYRDGVTDPVKRARLCAEIDGLIAHLYGLTEEEFTHILSAFPLVEQTVKDAALDAYREFAPKPGDQEIAALIAKGESATLEFKSSARWDMKQNKADKLIEGIVVKTVAALLNSEGGALLLGVDDDRNVIGLDHDYKLFGKKDSRDAYENFLTGLLLNSLGKDSAALISITFHELDGKDVCKVEANKSPKPVFVKDSNGEHLYIRAGNSTRQPTTKEAIDYCKMHWP